MPRVHITTFVSEYGMPIQCLVDPKKMVGNKKEESDDDWVSVLDGAPLDGVTFETEDSVMQIKPSTLSPDQLNHLYYISIHSEAPMRFSSSSSSSQFMLTTETGLENIMKLEDMPTIPSTYGLICTGDQLVMTYDNGPYGWKRVDRLIAGLDSVMWCTDYPAIPVCQMGPIPRVDDDTFKPLWVKKSLGIVKKLCIKEYLDFCSDNCATYPLNAMNVLISSIMHDFYNVSIIDGGGADIGPYTDTPRPNTYVANGFVLHTGEGIGIFGPTCSVTHVL